MIYVCISFAVIDCGGLGPPANGGVELSNTFLGSLASYSCNPLFRLVGSVTRICMENREWSPDAPICERKQVPPLCLLMVNSNGIMTRKAISLSYIMHSYIYLCGFHILRWYGIGGHDKVFWTIVLLPFSLGMTHTHTYWDGQGVPLV